MSTQSLSAALENTSHLLRELFGEQHNQRKDILIAVYSVM